MRMLSGLALGLLLANILEAMRWTRNLARLAYPLAKLAHLSSTAASAFALAFISPASANALLSEKHSQKAMGKSELMLANLFNGLPSCLSHTPTLFFLTWPVIGSAAITYVGIALIAAFLRTVITILLGRWLLPKNSLANETYQETIVEPFPARLKIALAKAWQRFCKRMPRLILFTAPVYVLMYLGQSHGLFTAAQAWLATHLDWISFLKPQTMGIIVMQLLAEMGATLGACGAALADGSITHKEVVTALLVGNVLATPLRAIRHQLPAYVGFYQPTLALRLVAANQALRALSMIVVIAIYLQI